MLNRIPFKDWFEALKVVANHSYGFDAGAISEFDEVAWQDYYDEGKSPEQALAEDCAYES